MLALFVGIVFPVSNPRRPAQSPARAPQTLAQLMKGTLYPESNVVFAAQDENPADVPHAKDPGMSTDLLTSYGKWEAVENSALAIAEVATSSVSRPQVLEWPGCSGDECGLGQVCSGAAGRGNDSLRGG